MSSTSKPEQGKPEPDMFAKRWLVALVVMASLLMPLLMGCGVKGDLKRPAPAAAAKQAR